MWYHIAEDSDIDYVYYSWRNVKECNSDCLVHRIFVHMVITSIILMLHKWNDCTWNLEVRNHNGC